jgi:Siphovirus Gp157
MATNATPLIPFQTASDAQPLPTAVAADHSLLELDSELDALLDRIQDEIEAQGEASAEAMDRFQLFCQAMDVKIDRIGRFLGVMETRAEYCKKESARYAARAKRAQNKIDRTESMVLYYLASHDLKKVESQAFTLKRHKNSQDSVEITQPGPAFLLAFAALRQRSMVRSGSK